MSETATPQGTIQRWVTFHLDGETYGVDVLQVQEVLRVGDIVPIPGTRDDVLGVINLRGRVVTVIDARRSFGLPSHQPDSQARILIVETQGQVVGLLVDSVSEVIGLAADEVETAPEAGNMPGARYLQGVAHRRGELVIGVDLGRLLAAEGQRGREAIPEAKSCRK
jgi:purine-binding chemotaxis protein CheW